MSTLNLTEGPSRLLNLLAEMPLASVRDLTGLAGISSTLVYERLDKLRKAGLVDSVALGWTCPLTSRWYLTDRALYALERLGGTWHEEYPRCRLLERLPSVEWFYQITAQVNGLGPFRSFHWMDNISVDAVVRYEYGWIALFWSGSYQSEDLIAGRLQRLAQDLRNMAVSREAPWPGLLAFVVSDEWQRELVYRAARRYHMQDQVSVWCTRDGSRAGARYCRASRGWVSQPVAYKDTGGWGWQGRLDASPWTEKRCQAVGDTLDVVSQWPGSALELVRQKLDEGSQGKSAQNACKALFDAEYIDRMWHCGRYRHKVTARGVDVISRRDRVHFSHCRKRIDSLSWVNRPALRAHEDGIMSFMGACLARGMPVAAGWRSWEHLGGRGGIAPDGMTELSVSPFGPTWAYFENERTARGDSRVTRKIRGYAAPNRRDAWPVLFVVWDDDAEAVYHRVGRRMRIPMLTTTFDRLREFGPFGNTECWSQYGLPVLIS